MEKEEILLTFIASRDPYNENGSDGPILSFLKVKKFNKVILLYTNMEFLQRAYETSKTIRERHPDTSIELKELQIEIPIDYEEIFLKLWRILKIIENNHDSSIVRYSILTDSGTPQMQTCWLLMVTSGLFNAKMYQGIPPQYSGGIYKAREIQFSYDKFPTVLKPPSLLDIESKLLGIALPESSEKYPLESTKIIGNEKSFVNAKAKAIRITKYDLSVLIIGETGTGKELFARLIHNISERKEKPFVTLNCSAINPTIAESEFFGYKKGAFTGATEDRTGYFKIADGGTIFLDEVGDLPLELQPKLLRVLENGTFFPVGSNKEVNVNVRIIAATNQNLEELCRIGKFRLDLYNRLNQVTIELPPLRKRKSDIPILAKNFVEEWNRRYNENKYISEEVLPFLVNYNWPGNIRELQNVIINMCALSPHNKITIGYLPEKIKNYYRSSDFILNYINELDFSESGINVDEILKRIEKEIYRKALHYTNGNKTKAAVLLNLKPHTFRKRLRERFNDYL